MVHARRLVGVLPFPHLSVPMPLCPRCTQVGLVDVLTTFVERSAFQVFVADRQGGGEAKEGAPRTNSPTTRARRRSCGTRCAHEEVRARVFAAGT